MRFIPSVCAWIAIIFVNVSSAPSALPPPPTHPPNLHIVVIVAAPFHIVVILPIAIYFQQSDRHKPPVPMTDYLTKIPPEYHEMSE